MVGTDSVAKAAPDGHTLLVMESSAALHKWLHKDVPFDVVADFAPVARVATSPLMLFAQSVVCRRTTCKELIALAKEQPGKLSAGTPGVGTPHHLALLMMNALAKIDIVHVPYRGAALCAQRSAGRPDSDDLGGADRGDAACRRRQGQSRSASRRPQRLPSLPQVPTIAESGVPGFDLEIFFGVAAPAKTPPRSGRAARQGDRRDLHAARRAGADPRSSGSIADLSRQRRQFRALIRDDHERFGKIIRDAGIAPN